VLSNDLRPILEYERCQESTIGPDRVLIRKDCVYGVPLGRDAANSRFHNARYLSSIVTGCIFRVFEDVFRMDIWHRFHALHKAVTM